MRNELLGFSIAVCGLMLILVLAPSASASPPQVIVTYPDGGETLWGTQTIRWSGASSPPADITYEVYLSVKGGAAWHLIGENTYSEGTGLSPHVMTFNTVGFEDSEICLVKVVAKNRATGEENSDQSDSFFKIQNSLPAPTLLSPTNGATIQTLMPTLDWADVESPWRVENYEVVVSLSPTFAEGQTVFHTFTSISEVNVNVLLTYQGWYYWRVRAKDERGAVSEWSKPFSFEEFYTAPVITSFEPEKTYTPSTSIRLSLSQMNVFNIQFSTDGIIWSDWEPYSDVVTFELSGPDGPKNIYVRGKREEKISESKMVTVILDREPPTTIREVVGELGAEGYKGYATVVLTTMDQYSGVENICYRIDGGEWITLRGDRFTIMGDGKHFVQYRATDRAGNVGPLESFEVTIYTPVSPVPYAAFFGGAVGFAIAWVVMWKRGMPKIADWRRQRQLRSRWFKELVGWEKEKMKKAPVKPAIIESYRELLAPAAKQKARKARRKRA